MKESGEPAKCTADVRECPRSLHSENISELRAKYEEEQNATSSPVELKKTKVIVRPEKIADFGVSARDANKEMSDEEFNEIKKQQVAVFERALAAKTTIPLEEREQRERYIGEALKRALFDKQDTESLYATKDEKGNLTYSPERAELHNKIMQKMLDDAKNVPNEGKVIFTGGVPGAGKTTELHNAVWFKPKEYYVPFDPDAIKEQMAELNMIPKIEGLTPMESQTLAHNEASYITRKMINTFAKERKNIVIQGTLRSFEGISNVINNLQSKGYKTEDTRLLFVEANPDTAKRQADERYSKGLDEFLIKGKGIGGRFIPESYITSMYDDKGESILLNNAKRHYDEGRFGAVTMITQ